MSQLQDLQFYADNSVISTEVLLSDSSLTTITHRHGTSSAWLLSAILEDLLLEKVSINSNSATSHSLDDPRSSVLFVSFTQDLDFFGKLWKKYIGLSFSGDECLNCHRFRFVSGLHDFSDKPTEEVFQKLLEMSENFSCVILEGFDLLWQISPCDSLAALSFLHKLNQKRHIFLSFSIQDELIDLDGAENEFVRKNTDIMCKLLHRSNLILNVRPLETGRAQDVTGTLTVSKGPCGSTGKVAEKEYLYVVDKEGGIKLFFR